MLLYSIRYTKQPLDYPDILAMLKERGLIIRDDDKAIDCLRIISYFRLANYFHPMEADKVNHIFKPNSLFDNAVDLYEFDRELRSLIFSAIQNNRKDAFLFKTQSDTNKIHLDNTSLCPYYPNGLLSQKRMKNGIIWQLRKLIVDLQKNYIKRGQDNG